MKKGILLVMPVPFRKIEGRIELEEQACNYLMWWTENFGRIIVACPLIPEELAAHSENSITWKAIAELPCAGQIEIVPLPYAYKMTEFIKTYKATSQLLRTKIQECHYLCFVLCTVIGDWGAIACLEAIKLKRPYAIWIDRVEYEVVGRSLFRKESLKNVPFRQIIQSFLILPFFKPYQRYLCQHSHLGLFQGLDCYSAYSPFCNNSYCIYETRTQKSDQIDASSLDRKLKSLADSEPLLICYVGRAAFMKGPLDWLRTIHRLCEAGVNLKATWIGDGPLLSDMQSLADELGIADKVNFIGFIDDLQQVLEYMKQHHIFLFCHKTPESARCLTESLVCGCPIVGYSSFYPEGIVSKHGGGAFVEMNNWHKLADLVIELNADRTKIRKLILDAAQSGRQFDGQSLYKERSELIRKYLPSTTDEYLLV